MEPMEPMRVLPVYSYRPIMLNRFDLLFALLFAFLSRSRARRLFSLLLLFLLAASSSVAGPSAMPRTTRKTRRRENKRRENEDEEEEEKGGGGGEEEKEEKEEEGIEQDRGGNFIARANQTKEGWTEGGSVERRKT